MKQEYVISKLINNNIVFSTDEKNNEVILFGKAIGFSKKSGDIVKATQILRIFTVKNNDTLNYLTNLVENIDAIYIDLATQIIDMFEKGLNVKINDIMAVSLSDHISNAVNNKRNGIDIPLSINSQISILYPKEYSIAKESLKLIKDKTGVELSESEAGYIVLHYINSQSDDYGHDARKLISFEQRMLEIIENHFSIKLDKNSFYCRRFLTHIEFLVARINNNEKIDDPDTTVYEILIKKYPNLEECVLRCSKEIYKDFNTEVSIAEKGFLAIHISNMLKAFSKENK